MKRAFRRVILTFGLLLGISPFLVGAVQSTYGANYAYDHNLYKSITVCDRENDSNGAYAVFNTVSGGNGLTIHDANGSAAGCSTRTVLSTITVHWVCEDVAFRPDPCGLEKYTQ